MSGKLKQAVLVSYFFKISKASLIFGLVFFQMSLKEAPFAMLQDPGSIVASTDGFATFAVRAFLSMHFWSAFSLVAFRFCLLSSLKKKVLRSLSCLIFSWLCWPS